MNDLKMLVSFFIQIRVFIKIVTFNGKFEKLY